MVIGMRLYHCHGSHGILTRTALLKAGLSRTDIERAEATKALLRVDRSRYALPNTKPNVLAAARAGGTLTCISALRLLGIWTPTDDQPHVRRSRYARRNRALPPNLRLCPSPGGIAKGPVDNLDDALLATLNCHDLETSVMVLDSVLAQRLRTRAELEVLVRIAGANGIRALSAADGCVDSALESVVRTRLRRRGVQLRTQVQLPGVGRVDFLIGNYLIVELDGWEFHRSPEQFANDRQRDRAAARLGYVVLRFTWHQVMDNWEETYDDIRAVLQRRRRRLRKV